MEGGEQTARRPLARAMTLAKHESMFLIADQAFVADVARGENC